MIDPWPRLGIARTDDRRAIRKAYAARLKTIDVEAHPAAFVDLREGLEHALAWAADAQWRAENGLPPADEMQAFEPATQGRAGPVDGEVALAEDEPQPGPEEQWVDQGEQAWVPPLPDDGNELYRSFDHLLFGLDGADPDREALLAATRDILAHLADESIDRAARVELWLAESVLAAIPRSNPILYMLVTHFGWDRAAGRIDQPYVFSEVVRRMEIYLVVDQVSQPGHRLHSAWKDLTSTRPKLGPTAFLRRDKVWNLLHAIRTQCPWAEETLQPHRVALWEERLANQSGGRFRWLWIFLGILMLGGLGSLIADGPPPPDATRSTFDARVPLYQSKDNDLARAIAASEGLGVDLAAIGRENPEFYSRLGRLWTDSNWAGHSYETLQRDVAAELDQAYADGLRAADGDLLEQHWQLVHDRLVYLRDRPDDCAAFLMGAERDYGFPPDLDRRAAALRATFILYTPATPALGSAEPRVAVPPGLFDDARVRAGLSETEMRNALAGRGPNRARCPARVALIEAALTRGDGRQFLREVVAAE